MKNELKLGAWLLSAAFLFASGNALALNGGGDDDGSSGGDTGTGFPGVSSFASDGPFATTNENLGGVFGSSCEVYRPTNLGQDGLDHPIIIWGNGTGSSPSTYSGLLDHWASHGFVVAAASTSNAGSGEEMLDCLNELENQNGQSFGDYADNLDLGRVGTSGHSQGGGGAIMAGTDSRITATGPMQPYTIGLGHETSSQYQQNGPMFLMAGGSDSIASPGLNQDPVFSRANVPVFYGTLDGASHFEPTGSGGGFRGPSTAWFRYHLMDDQGARELFYGSNCTLCTSSNWDVERKDID